MTLDEIAGGSPYGITTIAGGDGSRQPSQIELEGARFQGRHIAEIADRLFPRQRSSEQQSGNLMFQS